VAARSVLGVPEVRPALLDDISSARSRKTRGGGASGRSDGTGRTRADHGYRQRRADPGPARSADDAVITPSVLTFLWRTA